MCGRFADPDPADLSPNLRPGADRPRRFNVKPTQDVWICAPVSQTGGPELRGMAARWGLVPSWHRGSLAQWRAATFNARLEDARDRPSFRAVWRFGRCLIPASGFYEWTGSQDSRWPHYVTLAKPEATLWFAGLASRWNGLLSCTILTRAANETMADRHDRMPVVLSAEERAAWLGGSDDPALGGEADLHHHRVARFGPKAEGAGLIAPLVGLI